ncbi:hypothetical protein BJV78DRAFT_1162430 [Lactifluus subvellereus]|nr:hypothetical protein BJV78DRAFT_1162430 [Lactifluus subvellereus]
MVGRVFGLAALFFHKAVRALPQGNLEDLLGPELDEPTIPFMDQTIHHTEQASTLPLVEHATSVPPELTTTYTARLTTVTTGTSLHFSTPTSSSQLPTPASEGNDKHSKVLTARTSTSTSTSMSTSQSSTISTWHPSSSPPAELAKGHTADWHVIGIAVIVVSVVGTAILVIVFFDQWWGFLGDVCGRRKKRLGGGREVLVPDWKRGSWEFKVEDNLPAYPSFGSPPTLRIQEGAPTHAQLRKAEMPVDQRRDQDTLFDGLTFPPVPVLRENISTQDTPYRSSRRCLKQPSRHSGVNGVAAYRPHPLSRSDTRRSTASASEDAYDGLDSE